MHSLQLNQRLSLRVTRQAPKRRIATHRPGCGTLSDQKKSREMRNLSPKTRVPTAVSLTLIFAYSMLMAIVPPTQSSVDLQFTEQAPASAQAELVLRANAVEAARDEAEATLQ